MMDGAAILEPQESYNPALVGTANAGHGDVFVYSYTSLVNVHKSQGMTRDEAVEFTDYNTIRALDYMGSRRPVVVYDLLDEGPY
jgi:hypothetical protein